ncbi:lysozyme [Enterobacter ludwigii]|uniref:lysozyme n=1 Tax=Enterobacter ludwigii TaxID=299767 RepID=UPI003974CE08
MKTGSRGIALIKAFEGLRLTAYRCAADVWTIGYGHTAAVKNGDTITADDADSLLLNDIAVSEQAVSRAVTAPLNQSRFDALVSLVFNIGQGNFRRSTLLKKLNNQDYTGASDEFLRWTRAGGKVVPGLVRRREAEKALFDTPGRKSDSQ